MKYRKKPVVVEAFQWFGDERQTEEPEWIKAALESGVCEFCEYHKTYPNKEVNVTFSLYIHTLEGIHHVSPGDYIIRGVQGELYPCKPDIFERTYEVAE